MELLETANMAVFTLWIVTGRGLPDINLNLDSDADMILDGSVENGRFGTALAVVDLNKDGIDDLAISAPSTGLCVNFSNSELFPVWEKGLSYALKPKSEKNKKQKKKHSGDRSC